MQLDNRTSKFKDRTITLLSRSTKNPSFARLSSLLNSVFMIQT